MRTAKRTFSLFLCCGVSLLLSACGTAVQEETSATPLEIAAAVADAQSGLPVMYALTPDEDQFSIYLTNYYALDEGAVEDGAICYAGGVEASEVAVLRLSEEADADGIAEALEDYTADRAADFAGYVPEQAAMAEHGQVAVNGRYVALLICPEPEQARAAFLSCFEEDFSPSSTVFADVGNDALAPVPESEGTGESEPPLEAPSDTKAPQTSEPDTEDMAPVTATATPSAPYSTPEAVPMSSPEPPAPAPLPSAEPIPEPVEDEYNAAAVLSAWRSGDSSGLSAKNLAVLTACSQTIDQIITDGMTDYEKELAVHDWITAWGQYDPEVHSHAPDAAPDPDNSNPYGLLVHQVAICRGYASTFQLFMDLLGVECITVAGASGDSEHAWNMVRLEDEWYCVDVTWDDPSGGSPGHRYFNVTSQFLRDTNHQWEADSVPEATAVAYQWKA